MTGLDRYKNKPSVEQMQILIEIQNPEHSKVVINYAQPERVRRHFEAAKFLGEAGIDRQLLVGDFLVTTEKAILREEEEAIEEFLQSPIE